MTVRLSGIRKSYGNVDVIHGAALAIHTGAFVVLAGPAGRARPTSRD